MTKCKDAGGYSGGYSRNNCDAVHVIPQRVNYRRSRHRGYTILSAMIQVVDDQRVSDHLADCGAAAWGGDALSRAAVTFIYSAGRVSIG